MSFCVCVYVCVCVCACYRFSTKTLKLGETAAWSGVSTHLYILSDILYMCSVTFPLWRLLSDVGDFVNGVCQVMKIIVAESSLDTGLLLQQMCCFCRDVWIEPIRCQKRQCQQHLNGAESRSDVGLRKVCFHSE